MTAPLHGLNPTPTGFPTQVHERQKRSRKQRNHGTRPYHQIPSSRIHDMLDPDDEPESGPEPEPEPERKPSRRRSRPNLPRGKKGDRKRKRQEGRASKTPAQGDLKRQEGFGGIQDLRNHFAEDRKALLLDDPSGSDKSPLTEPSSH